MKEIFGEKTKKQQNKTKQRKKKKQNEHPPSFFEKLSLCTATKVSPFPFPLPPPPTLPTSQTLPVRVRTPTFLLACFFCCCCCRRCPFSLFSLFLSLFCPPPPPPPAAVKPDRGTASRGTTCRQKMEENEGRGGWGTISKRKRRQTRGKKAACTTGKKQNALDKKNNRYRKLLAKLLAKRNKTPPPSDPHPSHTNTKIHSTHFPPFLFFFTPALLLSELHKKNTPLPKTKPTLLDPRRKPAPGNLQKKKGARLVKTEETVVFSCLCDPFF